MQSELLKTLTQSRTLTSDNKKSKTLKVKHNYVVPLHSSCLKNVHTEYEHECLCPKTMWTKQKSVYQKHKQSDT